jgi:electron transfer flavoprotein alpha subunit
MERSESTIVVVGEHLAGQIRPVTYELLACALQLREICALPVKAVLMGEDVEQRARDLAGRSGLEVVGVQGPDLGRYNAEVYTTLLAEILPDFHAAFVCFADTTQSWDFVPGLAARLGAACITGVERVQGGADGICFSRIMCNGKIVADLTSRTPMTMITVQPGAFKPPSFDPSASGSVEVKDVMQQPRRSRSLGVKRVRTENAGLAQADVIVSAGRGIGKRENLDLIHRLAELFPRSAVGGSRPICDLGWLGYKHQIGQTGATVTPKLYIACGISGASQHLAGMRGAHFIVGINTDPHAAIFNVADVVVAEDVTTFIPTLLKAYQEKKHQPA